MASTLVEPSTTILTTKRIRFIWLELTSKCQLECTHCYLEASRDGNHGSMTLEDWQRAITEAHALGVETVQFIGGEPTLHPHLCELIDFALTHGLEVEIYSNLVHVTEAQWKRFRRQGVRLATSFYSDDAHQHAVITGSNPAVLDRTLENIQRAIGYEIPLRIGRVNILGGQRFDEAATLLESLGVTVDPHVDYMRGVGRGQREGQGTDLDQLCGNCVSGVLAIGPNGQVWPCVFARGPLHQVGNVRGQSLTQVLDGRTYARVERELSAHFTRRHGPCLPQIDHGEPGGPVACFPLGCGPSTNGCSPVE